MLFDEENLKNIVYKLNGEAEMFYRKHLLNYKDEIWEKGHHYDKLKSKFKYPIISKRRYALDKFQFHVPITMNFKASGNGLIREQVNKFLKSNGIKHIIGIDRGERHLLYLSLIDLIGTIIKQFSLNEIVNEYNGNTYKTNYHFLLDKKERDKNKARRSWQTIETIKELKEGYLSQVIYKIAQLVVEYNAIVVLEDLNFGFMRGRQKIEKQVYQKFEKMLIDKFNYLVFKNENVNNGGGLFKAYQLTNKFESFQKMDKQNGFLFYIPAWKTSKIDPVTGFVNFFCTQYESIEKAKSFFKKFTDIRYNNSGNYFEFVVDDYTKFNAKSAKTRQNWTICTYGKRIDSFRNPDKNNQWDCKEIDLTDEFKTLFGSDLKNLKQYIIEQTEKSFFERLLYLFKLTVQLRNSVTGTDTDYMISPVADNNGCFFDTRVFASKISTVADTIIEDVCKTAKQKSPNLPVNADANGAYNIARKGLIVIDKIKNATDLSKVKLAITNREWLQFVQQNNNK
jgi:CRISPR-associated protein Cpf1